MGFQRYFGAILGWVPNSSCIMATIWDLNYFSTSIPWRQGCLKPLCVQCPCGKPFPCRHCPGFVLQGGWLSPARPSQVGILHPVPLPVILCTFSWCQTEHSGFPYPEHSQAAVSNSLCCSTNSLEYNALSAEEVCTSAAHRAVCGTRSVLFRGYLMEAGLAGAAGTHISPTL